MVDSVNFQAMGDRLPPQNLEAEEAILGGILLDPEAIARVIDLLVTDAFSLEAHKIIYRAALALHSQQKPTDLMTVAVWLSDNNQLEKVGGQTKLVQLIDRTVSAVNIDQYAMLVTEKYLRRKLIQAGHKIVDFGYETATELPLVFDRAEQEIFSITQDKPQRGLIAIGETLFYTFKDLERRSEESVGLPGLTCGFYDLDAMTSGFQRSDLVIVAGRPSMGKTAFSICIAKNIAAAHHVPVAIFSLEMSKEQLAQRLLASEASIESNRLRSGRITQNEWEPIGSAINSLSNMPIFIDDTANVTVTQMRSEARRLQAEQNGELGLILIDYLQLMETGSDNRVQELSKITRSLKGLARELNVPIIALSQLSRGVESRTNKRPMMSDLRESGCLTGDSLVTLADSGIQVPIRDLVGKSGFAVWALHEATMKLERAVVSHAFATGIKPVFRLTTRLGRTIRATGNHKFLNINGWQRLDELKICSRIAVPNQVFEQPQAAIGVFLRHLWSTDGCIQPTKGKCLYPAVYYTSSSERLSRDVQALLLRMGINSKLSRVPQIGKGRDQYQVWVSGKYDLEKFVELIGAVGNYKQQNLKEVATYIESRSACTNRDVVPREVWRLYAVPAMQKAGISIRQMQDALGVSHCGTTLYKHNLSRDRASRLALAVRSDEIERLAKSDIYWDEIVSIEADGEAEVYDLTVPEFHNFIANNVVVHNSIEQDADIVIMLYRDEYYNENTPDRGIAEVIISKHRNGPTGNVKLLFDPQYTRFRNLASHHRS